jgi:lysozyme
MAVNGRLIAKIGAGAAALVLAVVPVFEGTVLSTYKDPIGVLTSCTGHTGPELQMGQRFTKEQCTQQLADDLAKHADDLNCIKVPLSDREKAAYLSFTFNVGRANFCGSTLVRKLNAGDHPGACAELSKWVYADGKQLPGLINRRAAEREMCEAK